MTVTTLKLVKLGCTILGWMWDSCRHYCYGYRHYTIGWINAMNYRKLTQLHLVKRSHCQSRMLSLITRSSNLMELFLNVFTEFSEFSDHKYSSLKGLDPGGSCVRDQDATTAPTRHIWEMGSLNWRLFMLQWFIAFPEFAEITDFNASSAQFRKILSNES